MKIPGFRTVAIGLCLTVTLLAVGISPASAHPLRAYVISGGAVRGYVETSFDHLSFSVCDTLADNVGVYGRFQFQNGTIIDIVDGNGSQAGCGSGSTTTTNPLVRMEAVWRAGATSGWVNA